MKLNKKVMDNSNLSITLINHDKEVIEIEIIKIDKLHYLTGRNVLYKLNLTLLQIIKDLETVITFTRSNTQHNWVGRTGVDRNIKYYDIISSDGYYSDLTLVFILHPSILHSNPFTYFYLFSISSSNPTTIIPPRPNLTSNENLYQNLDLTCGRSGLFYLRP